jgi:hypothetical protein
LQPEFRITPERFNAIDVIAVYFHCGGLDLYPVQVTHGKSDEPKNKPRHEGEVQRGAANNMNEYI